MQIPSEFTNQIQEGRCTLFLGAGASQEAGAPSANQLGKAIACRLLGEKRLSIDLARAVSLAVAHTGNRRDVEEFVTSQIRHLKPSPSHLKIPWYPWRAIVTTNYDTLIEQAYQRETAAFQELTSILRVEDLPKIGSAAQHCLPLLKPHGCLSRPESMVLGLEELHKARQERSLLFRHVETLHVLGPVIYVGYSLQDVHILDMIYDLNERLGQYRRPILFVTRQRKESRGQIERRWVEQTLKGDYLACGFRGFMNLLSRQLQPAIGQSKVIPQMAPCRSFTFAGNGSATYTASHEFRRVHGVWECWLRYTIYHEGGYAGVVFERLGDPLDISNFKVISFELNVGDVARKQDLLEALKLESPGVLYPNLLNVASLKGRGWNQVRVGLKNYGVDKKRLTRVVLADNGHRAELGQEYRIGLRNVEFK